MHGTASELGLGTVYNTRLLWVTSVILAAAERTDPQTHRQNHSVTRCKTLPAGRW